MFVYDDANYFDSGLMDFVTALSFRISDVRFRICFNWGYPHFHTFKSPNIQIIFTSAHLKSAHRSKPFLHHFLQRKHLITELGCQ
jgi:hypothetical protein